MPNCGACGKFTAVRDTVKCNKCPASFHRICVNLPASANISPNWMCPGCKAKQPRADNSQTPVKGIEICPSPPADAGIQVVERSMAEQKELLRTTSLISWPLMRRGCVRARKGALRECRAIVCVTRRDQRACARAVVGVLAFIYARD
ncbi:hypothetical protein B5X24_HaOG216906 [Helicoverpa armigera]|uniref:PHD-type domain-containing protein n=1 Tax=Helicoverpa armigera TaxID=29058 RepID=A0A2W1B7P9_HELAM|nr:hypothetical protein B5X24_HaOG216906 [Helicoverpa armigera]